MIRGYGGDDPSHCRGVGGGGGGVWGWQRGEWGDREGRGRRIHMTREESEALRGWRRGGEEERQISRHTRDGLEIAEGGTGRGGEAGSCCTCLSAGGQSWS